MAENKAAFFQITFVRHGESVGNAQNRLQGLSDFPLSETGQAQVRALAARWQAEGLGFDLAISSPLARAAETARILVDALEIPLLELEPLWVERDMGGRSGLTMAEIRARFESPDFVNTYDSIDESGESEWEVYLRAGQALNKILTRPPARILVVTHGAILNMALYAILGIAPQPNFQGPRFGLQNSAFASLRYYPQVHRWRVDVIGDRNHWQPAAG